MISWNQRAIYHEAQVVSIFQAAHYEDGKAKTIVDYKPGKGLHKVWDTDFQSRLKLDDYQLPRYLYSSEYPRR